MLQKYELGHANDIFKKRIFKEIIISTALFPISNYNTKSIRNYSWNCEVFKLADFLTSVIFGEKLTFITLNFYPQKHPNNLITTYGPIPSHM